jgi:hypothetical protein
MGVKAGRIGALRAVLAAATPRTPSLHAVDQELQELGRSSKVLPERRRHLLQVFHSMRALESALKALLRSYESSLGRVLYQLRSLPTTHPLYRDASALNRYLRSLPFQRNRLMHQANAFPRNAKEADEIVGEITTCFSLFLK